MLLANCTYKISLPPCMPISSSGLPLWYWKMGGSCFHLYTLYFIIQEKREHLFPLHWPQNQTLWNLCHLEQVPGPEPSLWVRISGIWLTWTAGCLSILQPISLSRMLSPDGLGLIRVKSHTRVESTSQNPHDGPVRMTRRLEVREPAKQPDPVRKITKAPWFALPFPLFSLLPSLPFQSFFQKYLHAQDWDYACGPFEHSPALVSYLSP